MVKNQNCIHEEINSKLNLGKHRWEDNIKMDCKEIGLEGVEWIHLAGSCEHSNEPLGSVKGREFLH
jgi:hypothetical protein